MRTSATVHGKQDITGTDTSGRTTRYQIRGLDGWWTTGQALDGVPRESAPDSHWLQLPREGGDTYQALTRWVEPRSRQRKRRPDGPVDALYSSRLLSPRRDSDMPPAGFEAGFLTAHKPAPFFAAESPVKVTPRPRTEPIRGAAAILERLESKGVIVRLAPSRIRLVVEWPEARVRPEHVPLIELVGPLLLAHLRGEVIHCDVTDHGAPVEAMTIAVGGTPSCMACVGAKAEAEPKAKPGIIGRLTGAAA